MKNDFTGLAASVFNTQAVDTLVFSGDYFAAVPEPTSATLLGLALVARRR